MFDVTLLDQEVQFRFTRSQGKGGQHVNKVATRAELWFDLEGSAQLSAEQKDQLRERLANRLSQEGWIVVSCQEHRSQWQNRQGALLKFHDLINRALQRKKQRLSSQPPKAARARRLRRKRQLSEKKTLRRKVLLQKDEGLSGA